MVAKHSLEPGCCVAALGVAAELSQAALGMCWEVHVVVPWALRALLPRGAELWVAQTRHGEPGEPGGSLGPCFMSRASSSFQLWPVGSEDQRAVWF